MAVAVGFLLLNLPFWWLGREHFLSRAWLNVDLLMPLVLAPVSMTGAAIVLLFSWAIDLGVSESLAWNFHSPSDFVRSVEFLPLLHATSYVSWPLLTVGFGFLACGALAWCCVHWARRAPAAAFLILGLVFIVDVLNGSSTFWSTAQRRLPGNVGGSAIKMVASGLLSGDEERVRPLSAGQALTAQFDLVSHAQRHSDRGILLLVVESWGISDSAPMRQLLHDRLVTASIAKRFRVSDSKVPFRGSTVDAELRELCGLAGNYRLLGSVTGKCLPNRLQALGWQTTGLHGFTHRMFNRNAWWKQTGIRNLYFAEDLADLSDQRCGGAFAGICDAVLIRRAVAEAARPKSFVYALTLNSHLPLAGVPPDPATQLVCDRAGVDRDVCALTATIGTALAVLSEALSTTTAPPLVLVVGDHAPPFTSIRSRNQFDPTSVPGIVLVPR